MERKFLFFIIRLYKVTKRFDTRKLAILENLCLPIKIRSQRLLLHELRAKYMYRVKLKYSN